MLLLLATFNYKKALLNLLKSFINIIIHPILVVFILYTLIIISSIIIMDINIAGGILVSYIICSCISIIPKIIRLVKSEQVVIDINFSNLISIPNFLLFLFSFYTFNLWIEMTIISIIIISIIIGLKEKYNIKIIYFITFIIIIHALYLFINNISDIKDHNFWISYLLPTMILVINIPILIIIGHMLRIESLLSLNKKNKDMMAYLKFYKKLYLKKIKYHKHLKKYSMAYYNDSITIIAEKINYNCYASEVITNKNNFEKDELLFLCLNLILGHDNNNLLSFKRFPLYIEIKDLNKNLICYWESPSLILFNKSTQTKDINILSLPLGTYFRKYQEGIYLQCKSDTHVNISLKRNGEGTRVLGGSAWLKIPKATLTDKELISLHKKHILNSGFNLFTIDLCDGTGYVFKGAGITYEHTELSAEGEQLTHKSDSFYGWSQDIKIFGYGIIQEDNIIYNKAIKVPKLKTAEDYRLWANDLNIIIRPSYGFKLQRYAGETTKNYLKRDTSVLDGYVLEVGTPWVIEGDTLNIVVKG